LKLQDGLVLKELEGAEAAIDAKSASNDSIKTT